MVEFSADGLASLVHNPALAGAAADDRRLLTSWSVGAAAKGEGTWAADYYGGVAVNAAGNAITAVGAPLMPRSARSRTPPSVRPQGFRLQGAFGVRKDV